MHTVKSASVIFVTPDAKRGFDAITNPVLYSTITHVSLKMQRTNFLFSQMNMRRQAKCTCGLDKLNSHSRAQNILSIVQPLLLMILFAPDTHSYIVWVRIGSQFISGWTDNTTISKQAQQRYVQGIFILYWHFPAFVMEITWWRHQMEPFPALLNLCVGNSPVTGEFPSQRLVRRSFDVWSAPE